MIMLRKIIVCALLVLCASTAQSQATRPTTTPPAARPQANAPVVAAAPAIRMDTLIGNFPKLHLEKKNYYVNENITIVDSLSADAGANIYLGEGVTIVCLGAVNLNGSNSVGGRIRITSGKGKQGTGFVIAAANNTSIVMNATTFDSLVTPISFTDEWFRPEVSIRNCQFIKNVGTTAIIQVLNPKVPFVDVVPVANFRITGTLFAANIAPIRFEDLQSDYLKIEISNNTFVGNKISGYGRYTFTSNMLFGRMDKMQNRFRAVIKDNSFTQNYMRDVDADTLVQVANVGIYGSGDSLAVPNNYWGADNEADARKGIYDYTLDYTTPKLSILPLEYGPSDTLPPHVYDIANTTNNRASTPKKMLVNDKWIIVQDSATYLTYNYNLRQGLRAFKMISNAPLLTRQMSVHYIYVKDSTLALADSTISAGSYTRDETKKNTIAIRFALMTDSMFRTRQGYLVIKDLTGQLGQFIPDVVIGYQAFLKYVFSKKPKSQVGKIMDPNDESTRKLNDPPAIITPYKKKYELGVVAGNAIYYGTLSNPSLFSNDFNSMFGVQFRYNLKKNFSISVSYLTTTLTGSDLRSGDTAKAHRGMSFSTPTTAISIQAEFDFFDHLVYNTKQRLHPMIGIGIDQITFNPMGEYLGKLYPLQPLGTGGQLLKSQSVLNPGTDSAHAPYALSSLGAPVTFQLRYFLNKKTIFSLFATYHLAFTNYLDDVGPDPYPDQAAVRTAVQALDPSNPLISEKMEAAAYFSNPTNRYVRKGQLRSGAADVSDGFFTFGFTLMHHF